MLLVYLDCYTPNTINWIIYEQHTFISHKVKLNDQQIIYIVLGLSTHYVFRPSCCRRDREFFRP